MSGAGGAAFLLSVIVTRGELFLRSGTPEVCWAVTAGGTAGTFTKDIDGGRVLAVRGFTLDFVASMGDFTVTVGDLTFEESGVSMLC